MKKTVGTSLRSKVKQALQYPKAYVRTVGKRIKSNMREHTAGKIPKYGTKNPFF